MLKKSSFLNSRAIKRWVKGRPIRKKIFFWNILLPFKNEKYFTLDTLSKNGHITLKFVGRYLSGLFPKNMTILVQKLGAEKKISKSVSGYFMTEKNRKTFIIFEAYLKYIHFVFFSQKKYHT